MRRLRQSVGRPAKHRRRARQYRARRERRARMGALVQVDASPFDWLEGRGPAMSLHGAIDDATGTVLALHFRPTEDLHGYTTVLAAMATQYGLPLALYGDRLNVFLRNDAHWSLEEQLQAPKRRRTLADPPGPGHRLHRGGLLQASGCVERLWRTLQDRLVSELRLRGVSSLTGANAFLPDFVSDYNRRFARPPALPQAAWRRPPRDLALLLGCRYRRRVAADNTVRLGLRWVQLPPGPAAAVGPASRWRCANCSMASSSCCTPRACSSPSPALARTSFCAPGAPRAAEPAAVAPLHGPSRRGALWGSGRNGAVSRSPRSRSAPARSSTLKAPHP